MLLNKHNNINNSKPLNMGGCKKQTANSQENYLQHKRLRLSSYAATIILIVRTFVETPKMSVIFVSHHHSPF